MGTDIHAAIEYRDGDKWHAVLSPNPYQKYDAPDDPQPEMTARLDIDRDYDLFAILANVRNGRGFGSIKTGEGFDSISDGRGLPDDISTGARDTGCTGDHSETWCSLAEILAFDWTRSTTCCGVVSAKEFEAWDRVKRWNPGPGSYCGGVGGPSVRRVSEDEMRAHVAVVVGSKRGAEWSEAIKKLDPNLYCRVSWQETYPHAALRLWTKILLQMLQLGCRLGNKNVRLVMNFDS
jgi:hypothetical protein